ncbi:peptidoglycan recognition family protein [Streptosporangium sp. NPDC020145]|uniref:peptidoglycan recognition protein family protein n=1 Tax=Streptosporangium sp. NPDC020145 TaxID=3154694 RepID=UPI00342605A2
MIDLVSRSAWGARAPRGAYGALTSTRGVKIHYTGGHVDPRVLDDHARCVSAVRGIQNGHMDGNGWIDIGYSMIACPHRKVFVGRGPGHLPAANGPGLNSAHYAVLGLVGNSGLVQPPNDMLLGILDAIDYLREHGGAGREIKGHRDGYSTDCPGDALYDWVRAGAPRPSAEPSTPPPPAPEEETMPEIVSLGLSAEVIVPPSKDYQPWWDLEWRDTAGWHPAGGQSIAPSRDVWADVVAHVALRGLVPGERVELGLTRHQPDGSLVDIAWPIGRLLSVHADVDGRVETGLGGHFKLDATARGRVTIRHTSTGPVTLETASAFKAILHPYA